MLGLLRRDDTGPTAVSTLAAATSLAARSLRGEDWLGRSGPNEFAVLLRGTAADTEVAATRLATTISELGIPGLGACAGVTALEPGTTAAETLRRAVLSLQTARSRGAGHVICYRGTAEPTGVPDAVDARLSSSPSAGGPAPPAAGRTLRRPPARGPAATPA